MQVGVARRDITPEPGVWMSGYAGRGAAESVLDPLELTALVIEAEGREVVVITADLLGFDAEARSLVLQRLGRQPETVLLAASHTHGGPAFCPNLVTERPHIDAAYRARVLEAAVSAVAEATAASAPAVGWHGAGAVGLGINRRAPQKPHGMVPHAAGFYDRTLSVLAFADPGTTRPRVVLFSAACHPTTLGAQTMISADWPGAARRALESVIEGCTTLFSQGCAGNIRPRTVDLAEPGRFRPGSAADVQRLGAACAHEVLRVLQDDLRPLDSPLATRIIEARLPLEAVPARSDLETAAAGEGARGEWAKALTSAGGAAIAECLDYPVLGWRFGETLRLVALPGEVVSELGAAVRASVGGTAMVTAYSNGLPCYIPTARIRREGGYEAGAGSMHYFGVPGLLSESCEQIVIGAAERSVGIEPAETNL